MSPSMAFSVLLTVIFSINAHQIVLVDMMPTTGYLTDMHAFALAETVLVILVTMEKCACEPTEDCRCFPFSLVPFLAPRWV